MAGFLGERANTRLALGAFGLNQDNRDAALADLLAGELSAVPGLDLVERRVLDAVLKEASLSLSGLVRAKEGVRVGALVRAEQFLLGSSFRLSGTNHLVMRLVDAKTGEIRALQVFREPASLPPLARDVAGFVRAEFRHPAAGRLDYVAIGVVQNLGVNNRFADFPGQMRANVAAQRGR